MDYITSIGRFQAQTPQEAGDKAVILEYARAHPQTILTRENKIAHITSSGFILSPGLDKALMAHHNIYKTWAWTGGHADGDGDLLAVALREAAEETGAQGIRPLTADLLSLDILPVWGHEKRGAYVSAHLHLSAAYVLIAPEDCPLHARPGENSAVKWIPLEEIAAHSGEPELIAVYGKLIARARSIGG